jgi:carboxymethylenebutenolidase
MKNEMKIQAIDNSGSFSAYVATPDTDAIVPVVIAIQEIFGVNANMREICDALAKRGFIAICPDLFWRQEPGIDLTDQSQAEWDKAFELYQGFNVDKGIEDIAATIEAARKLSGTNGKVGAIGYCLGGLLAYLTATRTDIDAAVGFYGVGIQNMVGEASLIKAPLILHIAEKDQFVDNAAQQKMHEALNNNPKVTLYDYADVDHAFAREGGKHYDKISAELANKRTLSFLSDKLGQ